MYGIYMNQSYEREREREEIYNLCRGKNNDAIGRGG